MFIKSQPEWLHTIRISAFDLRMLLFLTVCTKMAIAIFEGNVLAQKIIKMAYFLLDVTI